MLPWMIEGGVSYPSNAMAQALTGEFTEKAWARFKTATDIYCERNRLEPLGSGAFVGPRVSWSFDIHYLACFYDESGLTSIRACTSDRCASVLGRDYIYSKYMTCSMRRRGKPDRLCNPFNWHESLSISQHYECLNWDGALTGTFEYLHAYIDEHESWETTPPALGKGRLQVGLYCTDVLLPTRMMTAKRCTWACVNAPADIDFDNG